MKLSRRLSVIFIVLMILSASLSAVSCRQASAAKQINMLHGFKLLNQSYIDDSQLTVFQYEHIKSGAKVIYLKSDDENKVFSINFRTPAVDNTGVNHAIEHCLLDGSKNYPVKSLPTAMKGRSLPTYFSAETGSNYTSYTAASKNDKGFKNLISVYMDAVFYPNVLDNPLIFLQENGHYELDSPESELKYTGIVYNEVKAKDSPVNLLLNKVDQVLFSDSGGRFNSGGTPNEIPNLTYKALIKTYHKYYQPSNSYIYLYGNLNIEKILELLDANYLSEFERKVVDIEMKLPEPLEKSTESIYEYDVLQDTPLDNKAYLSWNCMVDGAADLETAKAFNLISTLIFDNPATPLRKALVDKGFDVYFSSNFALLQPVVLNLICENTAVSRKNEFVQVIEDELKKIAAKGIDKNDIAALLHSYEIKPYQDARHDDRGLQYLDKIRQLWLYGGYPLANMDYNIEINILQKALKENYFEKLIEEHLVKTDQKATVILKPVYEADEEKPVTSDQRLQEYKNILSSAQIADLVKQTRDLKKWQSEPDSKEALAKLPRLEISDLKSKNDIMIEQKIRTVEGLPIMFTPVETAGMNYLNFYFDTTAVPQDKIPYLKLLEGLLGRVDTEKYGSADLSKELQNKTAGDLLFYNSDFGQQNSAEEYSPKLMIMISALDKDLDAALNLLNQVMVHSTFTDRELLKSLVHEQRLTTRPVATSNAIGNLRMKSYISDKGKYNESLNGIPYYQFISDLDDNFDLRWNEIQHNLTEVYQTVFNKNGLIPGFVGNNAEYQVYQNKLSSLLTGMNEQKLKPVKYVFPESNRNEGLVTRQSVNSVDKGYNLKKLGYEYSGSMEVLETILDEYLYTEVREKGGAYGAEAEISRDGSAILNSSRDPQIKETLAAYDNAASYLRSFQADKQKMTDYIVGTIARMDSPQMNASTDMITKAILSQQFYLMGESPETLQKEWTEILNTADEDIRALADVIDAVMKQNCFCVAGGKSGIEKEKNIFKNIIYLTETDNNKPGSRTPVIIQN